MDSNYEITPDAVNNPMISPDNENYVSHIFVETNRKVKAQDNRIFALGTLLGVEEVGYHNGVEKFLVLMKTERYENKPQYLWVVLEKNDANFEMILQQKVMLIEGYVDNCTTFNNLARSHTFMVPEKMTETVNNKCLKGPAPFHLDYTVNNRTLTQGVIVGKPWKEEIPKIDQTVVRFKVEVVAEHLVKEIYVSIWEKRLKGKELKDGMNIQFIGSLNMLKKERELVIENGYVVSSKKNKLDSNLIVIQHLKLK